MKIFERFFPKMGKFYSKTLPLTYNKFKTKDVIINARKKGAVTLFDVSQMNYIKIPKSNDTLKLIEKQFPVNLEKLKLNKCELTVVLDNKSNIIDDFIITNMKEHYRLIVNSESLPIFQKRLNSIKNEIIPHKIIAIQGDGANGLLNTIGFPTNQKFMENIDYNGMEITRCGYTGMDGFEICGSEDKLTSTMLDIIDDSSIQMGGLVERDILRLEAGFCLSGNEFGLNMGIHFNETDLDFIIKKRRRRELGFIGEEYFDNKPNKMRKIFFCKSSLLNQKDIVNNENNKVGFITSSSFSFNKNCFIGMGYFDIQSKGPYFIKKRDKLEKIEFTID